MIRRSSCGAVMLPPTSSSRRLDEIDRKLNAAPAMMRDQLSVIGPSSRNDKVHMEVNMLRRNLLLAIAFGLATLTGSFAARAEDANQAALIKATGDAKHSLLQGISQVAKGSEVPIEAKYEMKDGKLMLSIYTSAKGFDTAAEDNSFNEYIGDA